MAELDNTVFGYFTSDAQAEAAVQALKSAGFTRNQISLAGEPGADAYASGSGQSTTGSQMRVEGRKAGEAVGGFWERIKEFFEGDTAEPYADEGSRGEMATHEITSANSVYDYDDDLHQSWGTTAERSRYFSQKYSSSGGGYIVSVHAGDRRAEAERILELNGADQGSGSLGSSSAGTTAAVLTPDYRTGSRVTEDAAYQSKTDVSGSGAGYDAAYAGSSSELTGTTPEYSGTQDTLAGSRSTTDLTTPRRIQLYGEVLRVHRDRIQRGEARIRKETITETQQVEVPVTREELVIERVPVSGGQPASGAAFGSDNEEIRIPLTEEVARVDKQPVVREEVEIGKREITNTENRAETVRREELRVDEADDTFRKAS